MYYVCSTTTCSGIYVEYNPSEKSLNSHSTVKKKVLINGGHGVATVKNLHTPKGVVTVVSDEDMEFLLKNSSFQRHVAAGHITYDKKKIDPEKKIVNMAQKDGSAPKTPEDFEESENSTKENKIYKQKSAKI